MRDGMEKAAEEIAPATEAMMKAALALDGMKDELTRDVEGSVHALAVAIARRILQREISADPSMMRDLIQRGLELLPLDAAIEVHLHPADLAQLGDELAASASRREGSVIRCVEDDSLERGSFLLESPFRLIDGRIDHALRSFYERLQHE
jgi:flagellar biosynthesis/type III secretory pathway protein FliH